MNVKKLGYEGILNLLVMAVDSYVAEENGAAPSERVLSSIRDAVTEIGRSAGKEMEFSELEKLADDAASAKECDWGNRIGIINGAWDGILDKHGVPWFA